MDNKTEGARDLAFLLSEANGKRSRNVATIVSGEGVVEAGTVIGKVTASSKFAVSPNAEVVGKEGAETATAVLAYTVDATDADVDGVVIDLDAEVKGPELIYHASVDDDAKKAAKATQLAAVGIRVR